MIKMSGPSVSGGGGISISDVIQYLLGSDWSGVSGNAGEYRRHKQAFSNGDV